MLCNYCGKEIIDGGICDCQFSFSQLDERQSQYPISQPDERQSQYPTSPQYNYQPQPPQYSSQQQLPQQYNLQPQQQPQYNYPPPQYNYPAQQLNYPMQPNVYYNPTIIRPPSNGPATTGFVFTMIGMFLGWIPVLGWIIWLLGLIFSIVGIAVSGSRGGTGRGLAITGLILSLIDLFIIILVLIGIIGGSAFDFFNIAYRL